MKRISSQIRIITSRFYTAAQFRRFLKDLFCGMSVSGQHGMIDHQGGDLKQKGITGIIFPHILSAVIQRLPERKSRKFSCQPPVCFPDFSAVHLRFISHQFIYTDVKIRRKPGQEKNIRIGAFCLPF